MEHVAHLPNNVSNNVGIWCASFPFQQLKGLLTQEEMDRRTGTITLAACDGSMPYREKTDLFSVCEMTWNTRRSPTSPPGAEGNQHRCTESCSTLWHQSLMTNKFQAFSASFTRAGVHLAVRPQKKIKENVVFCSTFLFHQDIKDKLTS